MEAGSDPSCLYNDRGTSLWTLKLARYQVDYHRFWDLAGNCGRSRHGR
jgi:hypothetical protein